MDIYEINKETIALVPLELNKTKVYEMDREILLNIPIMKIIRESCKSFGSSYEGRHDGTKKLIGVSHKSPIIIEETNKIIYFPTSSPKLSSCCWISLRHIKNYEKENKQTKVIFENGITLNLDISLGSFNNQYLHAMKLDVILSKKILNL